MENEKPGRFLAPIDKSQKNHATVNALPATPSFSFAEASSIIDIEIQAGQLLDYINKLTSLADRACSATIHHSETVRLMEANRHGEIAELRKKLDQQNEIFQEQRIAMIRLEQESKAQIAALETRLVQGELQRMQDQIPGIMRGAGHASYAEDSTRVGIPRDAQIHEQLIALNKEVATLKIALAKRDETIQAKNGMIKSVEADFRAKIDELEQRVRDGETQLHEQAKLVREKDELIQATAAKEAEVGKLIRRLSVECNRLHSELQEKNALISRSAATSVSQATDNPAWRRIIGRFQVESS